MPAKSVKQMVEIVVNDTVTYGLELGRIRVNFIEAVTNNADQAKLEYDLEVAKVVARAKEIKEKHGYKAGDCFYDNVWRISNVIVSDYRIKRGIR